MLDIVNEIDNATSKLYPYTDKHKRKKRPGAIYIHRDSVGPDVSELKRFFERHPEYTGGRFPYTFVVYPGGQVSQCVPMRYDTPDDCDSSGYGISVCCLGDFRKYGPTFSQRESAVELVAFLCQYYAINVSEVRGHTEDPGRSRDKNKKCPGDMFNMPIFRVKVENCRTSPEIVY